MQRYFISRLVQSVFLLFGVLLLVFIMVRVTGDPAALMMPREASPEDVEAFREKMGFNDPTLVQFSRFISGAITGDFGDSLHFKTPAMPMVVDRLPATVQLALTGLLFAVIVGIPLGLVGGFNPGSPVDNLGRLFALLGQSVPNFWLALIMILYFGVRLRWFPTFGRDEWKSVIMPAFVLGLPVMGQVVRLTRSAVLEIRGEDFIRTAHSKGLMPKTIYIKHVLRNVAIPLVSVIGIQFGYMLGGSIYIEFIFSWPGMGQLLQQSIGWRDFPLVQALAVFTSAIVLMINLLTDMAYAVIDPRIRYGN
ncbi:MAG: ABC transporter permease [Anaerolineae bacterium]|nr:ABC transporter permease [Anaerolineae bacterium]MBT4310139.1 ABC transporter permease [Anaerolineae bacterium]MBT4457923.1 ABC transporter permease [Anaerolineae bacterium]MBT4843412.1 ABC transporter permease [Anaerolineae bacterium]MBT6062505.1 ABC transporter permease [Anaerolineae bacterium]